MYGKLAILLSRMVLVRFFAIFFGITALLLTIEIATSFEKILSDTDSYFVLLYYAALRFPGVAANFVGLSVLIAVLLVFVDLSYHRELITIWSWGISPFRFIVLLLPLSFLLGVGHFLLVDRAIPFTVPQLSSWGVHTASFQLSRVARSEEDILWLRAGNDIIRSQKPLEFSESLDDVIIFRRDDEGRLLEQIFSSHAEIRNGKWVLHDVLIYTPGGTYPIAVENLIYSNQIGDFGSSLISGSPEEMRMVDLLYFIGNDGFGIGATSLYETTLHKRFSTLFIAFSMILLTIPLSLHYQRGRGLGLMFSVGIGLGFVFFIFDGISVTLGELGLISPIMASWAPIGIFSLLGLGLMFRHETL